MPSHSNPQPPMQQPQSEWVMPPWMEEMVRYVDQQLNWLDLVFFGLGVLVLGILLFVLLRRRKRFHLEMVEQYEHDIDGMKKRHMAEISKAEKRIEAFKEQLEDVEDVYSKKVRKIEKGHREVLSADEHSIFELKEEIGRLRAKQLREVESFEQEIQTLKTEIETMHEKHAKEIEQSEMEISDLRKQLNTMLYKI